MTVYDIVGQFGISIVTTGVVVWGGAKAVAGKWRDTRFASRLEGVKLEGQRQLELSRQEHAAQMGALSFERAGLLDRAAKLNQREFEIIPQIWNSASAAHYAVQRLISIWQESPDIGSMTEAQREAFLARSRLEEWQKEELLTKNRFEQTTYYADAAAWFRLRDANEAVVAFNRASADGSIFLHPETYTKIEAFGDLMRNAFRHWSVRQQFKLEGDTIPLEEFDKVKLYRDTGEQAYNDLGRYLRERYWITPEGKAL